MPLGSSGKNKTGVWFLCKDTCRHSPRLIYQEWHTDVWFTSGGQVRSIVQYLQFSTGNRGLTQWHEMNHGGNQTLNKVLSLIIAIN